MTSKVAKPQIVAIPEDVMKWILRIFIAVAVIIGLGLTASAVREWRTEAKKSEEKEHGMRYQEKFMLKMSPGGKSETFAVPPGMRGVVDGRKFLVHNMYADGSECAATEKCSGSSALAYVTNEDKKNENIVSVHFVSM